MMSSSGTPQRRYSSAMEITNGRHASTSFSPARRSPARQRCASSRSVSRSSGLTVPKLISVSAHRTTFGRAASRTPSALRGRRSLAPRHRRLVHGGCHALAGCESRERTPRFPARWAMPRRQSRERGTVAPEARKLCAKREPLRSGPASPRSDVDRQALVGRDGARGRALARGAPSRARRRRSAAGSWWKSTSRLTPAALANLAPSSNVLWPQPTFGPARPRRARVLLGRVLRVVDEDVDVLGELHELRVDAPA